ncbi:PREDICTED: YLS9 [Prunus dulcis]|uniref:PREDICTED: YLS9 n=1 Tax=Prunus dulcis TaxID=3755 RepID=A0A5E4FKS3_PRUDU|nr:PREDICTED: YLS9 [Prunus dulcis]
MSIAVQQNDEKPPHDIDREKLHPKVKEAVKIEAKSADQKVVVVVVDENIPLLPPSPKKNLKRADDDEEEEEEEDRNKFVTCIIYLFLLVILFFCATLYQTPKGFSSSSIQVHSFSVELFKVSVLNSQVTALWNISFFLTNPYSIVRVTYQVLDAEVFYRDEFLGGALIRPFVQQPEETEFMSVAVIVSPAVVSNQIAGAIDAERSQTWAVDFNVKIHAKIRVEWGGWRWIFASAPGTFEIWFNCEKLRVQFSSNATAGSILPGETAECGYDSEYR